MVAASFFSSINFVIQEFKEKEHPKFWYLISLSSLCHTKLIRILLCFWACLPGFLPLPMLISLSVNFTCKFSSSVLGKLKLTSKSLLSYLSSSCLESELLSVPSISLAHWHWKTDFSSISSRYMFFLVCIPMQIRLQESKDQKNGKKLTRKQKKQKQNKTKNRKGDR